MNRGVPCKYIVNKENCPYGNKCRFLHQYRADLLKKPIDQPLNHNEIQSDTVEKKSLGQPRDVDVHVMGSGSKKVEVQGESSKGDKKDETSVGENLEHHKRTGTTRICRFYLMNSRCRFGDKCRYIHTEKLEERELLDKKKDEQKSSVKDHSKDSQYSSSQNSFPERKGRQRAVQSVGTEKTHQDSEDLPPQRSGRESSQHTGSRNPPPLTLASFLHRKPVQRPHKASSRTQKDSSSKSLREVNAWQ